MSKPHRSIRNAATGIMLLSFILIFTGAAARFYHWSDTSLLRQISLVNWALLAAGIVWLAVLVIQRYLHLK